MSGGNPYQSPQGGYPQQPAGYPPQQGAYPPQQQQPYGQAGYAQGPYPPGYGKPHRGTMLLVFSLLSWFVCIIFGICAAVMAKGDMREMQAGQMDPSGMGLTKAAYWVSIANFIFAAVMIVLYIFIFAAVFATHK